MSPNVKKIILTNLVIIASLCSALPKIQQRHFELTIVHLNDFHARFLETSVTSGTCRSEKCYGGLGRVSTASRRLIHERPNALFLNAGDFYQGTYWHNVLGWNASVHFMNKLNYDVVTIGNHDFDDGIGELVPFLRRLNAPIVVTNIDDNDEPTIRGYYKNSTIVTRGDRKIGIIGVIARNTNTMSKTGKLRFLDEVSTVNAEAAKLTSQGVDVIIVLSHCGIYTDRIIASNCPKIDVIVGGHSHTLLYAGKAPSIEKPADEYPMVVKQNGTERTVLIVQAGAFTKYLGNLAVWLDVKGEVVDWEGNPILMDDKIEQDPKLMDELNLWKKIVDDKGRTTVGVTKSFLNGTYCRAEECNIADLVTDAMVHSYINKSDNPNHWTYAAISCQNAGGMRGDIPAGPITYGDLATVQPFDNTWDVVDLKGEDLYATLEESVAISKNTRRFWGASFLQWSGVKVVYNLTKPAYHRIVDVKVRCQACPAPLYEDLKMDNWYRVIVPTFVMNRGDNITIIAEKHRNHRYGEFDVPQIVDYVKSISPFDYKTDGRLVLLGKCCG